MIGKSEFDRFADEYEAMHRETIRFSGESPDFFADYKIFALREQVHDLDLACNVICDFGSGIGNSIPPFRRHFPRARLVCTDVSERSITISRTRFPGEEEYRVIRDDRLPLDDATCDAVFSACVFHHIHCADHIRWLAELRRVVKPSGLLALFEHNPLNPLTRYVVRTCPFDKNAVLVLAEEMAQRAVSAGWTEPRIHYHLFFPKVLRWGRPFEKFLRWVPIGAQYVLYARP